MQYKGDKSRQTENYELIQASLIRVSFGTGSSGLENSQADFPYFLLTERFDPSTSISRNQRLWRRGQIYFDRQGERRVRGGRMRVPQTRGAQFRLFRGSLQLHSRKLSAATKVPQNHPSRFNESVKADDQLRVDVN